MSVGYNRMVFVSVCWVEPSCGFSVLSRKEAVAVVCVCCVVGRGWRCRGGGFTGPRGNEGLRS